MDPAHFHRDDFPYQPFYCEENVYLLCLALLERGVSPSQIYGVFFSNSRRRCTMSFQRAAPEGHPVVWDYHVVVLLADAPRVILDFDSRLGFAVPEEIYLTRTVPRGVPTDWRPLARCVPGDVFLKTFSSDRRHMKYPHGAWHAEPPPWPVIRGVQAPSSHELPNFLDVTRNYQIIGNRLLQEL